LEIKVIMYFEVTKRGLAMKGKIIKQFWILILLNGLIFSSNAQNLKISPELLTDIEIMETVLDKLLYSKTAAPLFLYHQNAKGFYLMDYGVVFNVTYSHSFGEPVATQILIEKLRQSTKGNQVIFEEMEKVGKKVDQKSSDDNTIDELKKKITHFLSAYTSSLRNLKKDDRVSVVVDFNGSSLGQLKFRSKFPSQLIATVENSDLLKKRRGQLSDKSFSDKIKFRQMAAPEEDISILGNVIKTSLEHPNMSKKFSLIGDVKGIRFEGHGVVFITNINWGVGDYYRFFVGEQTLRGQLSFKTKEGDDPKASEQDVKNFERKIISAISNYGHTLKNLRPDDWIELAVNYKSAIPGKPYSKSIIKVQKKNIDDYYRDKTNFEQFEKHVQIFYY